MLLSVSRLKQVFVRRGLRASSWTTSESNIHSHCTSGILRENLPEWLSPSAVSHVQQEESQSRSEFSEPTQQWIPVKSLESSILIAVSMDLVRGFCIHVTITQDLEGIGRHSSTWSYSGVITATDCNICSLIMGLNSVTP